MKRVFFAPIFIFLVLLTSCKTMEGAQDDIDDLTAGQMDLSTLTGATSEALLASPCPPIEIVTDLSSISDFTDPMNMVNKNMICRVDIGNAHSTCQLSENTATVDLKLSFRGILGPKAKQKSTDKPFFSYPFFVAVTEPYGKIMAKEIFAASLSFGVDEKEHAYFENMRQIIPIKNKKSAKKYKILIGFQLSPEQLEFNRKNMVPVESKADNKKVTEKTNQ